MRKVDKTSKDSTWALMKEMLETFKIKDRVDIKIGEMRMIFPNGSEMLFRGLQDNERIRSIAGISDIWHEESSEFTLEDINQLDLRLRSNAKDLQIFYSFNPVSKANWTYKKWFAPGVEVDEENTRITHTTYKDNKFLPESYNATMENIRKTDPVYYSVYALGEFASLDKKVFNNWRTSWIEHDSVKDLPLHIGMDYGWVDPTTLVALRVDEKNKKVYVVDEFYQSHMHNETIADMITAKGYRKQVIVADAAEPKTINELRNKHNITKIKPAKKGPDSILFGIRKLQQFEIIVSPECEKVIEELENYTWSKDKSGEYIDKPIDNYNHTIDAIRYALEDIGKPPNTARVMSKSLLGL